MAGEGATIAAARTARSQPALRPGAGRRTPDRPSTSFSPRAAPSRSAVAKDRPRCSDGDRPTPLDFQVTDRPLRHDGGPGLLARAIPAPLDPQGRPQQPRQVLQGRLQARLVLDHEAQATTTPRGQTQGGGTPRPSSRASRTSPGSIRRFPRRVPSNSRGPLASSRRDWDRCERPAHQAISLAEAALMR